MGEYNVVMAQTGNLLNYRQLVEGPDATIWERSCANDLGRLAQGVGIKMSRGTNAILFIYESQVPKNRKVSYVSPRSFNSAK